MPPREKGLTKYQVSQGLTYVAQKPSFLQNFGAPPPSFTNRPGRDGREALPTRPEEGEWANGSDEEEDEEDDELAELVGAGGRGGDGPQVVVLKEGRHLSVDEIMKERRRAAGKKSPPPEDKIVAKKDHARSSSSIEPKHEPSMNRKTKQNTNKRKLVGNDEPAEKAQKSVAEEGEKKKKKKAKKGLLSFNEDEGED